jgi:ATP-dependent exoDNAse (exonuclease V) alpha subunit
MASINNLGSQLPKPKPDIAKLILVSKLRAKALREKLPANHYVELHEQELEAKKALEQLSSKVVLSFPESFSKAILPKEIAETLQPEIDTSLPVIQLNEAQKRAVELGVAGQSFVLIGPAGTGKTFTVKYILEEMIRQHKLPFMTEETKNLKKGDYGFIASSSTRRATNVVRKGLPAGLKAATGHSLLEYQPEFYADEDENGKLVNKMQFIATRNKQKPLPSGLQVVVLDEASMLSVEFYKEIENALPHRPQIIFIGDLSQLKPVFGDAILGYKLNELPVIELTQVYRQKDGEILDFVTDVRQGKLVTDFKAPMYNNERLTIQQFKTPERKEVRLAQFGSYLQKSIDDELISPLTGDLILCPFNVGVGTTELNKFVADYYDQKLHRQIIPVIAGMNTLYLAIGDKILIERNDAVITDIQINPAYLGRLPPPPSHKLNRWGGQRATKYGVLDLQAIEEEAIDSEDELELMLSRQGAMLSLEASIEDLTGDAEKVKLAASHTISYSFLDPTEQQIAEYLTAKNTNIETATSAGDVNKIELAYCISIHKAQGSQAPHVMLLLSNQHNVMLHRELLYTGATRAQNKLTIVCDQGNINKCISNARIKGETIAEKAEFFKGRSRDKEVQEDLDIDA